MLRFDFVVLIFGRKKSAQISILSTPIVWKTMFPVDWCAQIDFLIFLKKNKNTTNFDFYPAQPHMLTSPERQKFIP